MYIYIYIVYIYIYIWCIYIVYVYIYIYIVYILYMVYIVYILCILYKWCKYCIYIYIVYIYFVSIYVYIYIYVCVCVYWMSPSIYVACHMGMFNSKGGRVGSSHGFWGERWLDHSPHRQGDGLFSPRVGSRCLAKSDAKLSHRLWDRW